MPDGNWNDLRYFIAVAEHGSLSAAARQLGVNQPTVGRRIAVLEVALGAHLFHRHARGLKLTEAGARVFEAASGMAEAAAAVERAAAGDAHRPAGRVRVSAPESVCYGLLVPGLAGLRARYPEIEPVLQPDFSSADLPRGEADIAVRLYRPQTSDLVVRRVGTLPFALYASDAYLRAAGTPRSLAELSAHPLVLMGDRLAHLPEAQWLTRQAIGAHAVMRSDSSVLRARAAEAGAGIALVPAVLATVFAALRPVLPEYRPPARSVWLVTHRDLRGAARIRAVLDWVGEAFAASPG